VFDFSMAEVLVVAVVALVAIGPRDLPRALYALGRWVGKARALAGEFHRHVDDMMREAELEDFRRKAEELNRKSLTQVLENSVDPDGAIRRGLELPEPVLPEQERTGARENGMNQEKGNTPSNVLPPPP